MQFVKQFSARQTDQLGTELEPVVLYTVTKRPIFKKQINTGQSHAMVM